LWILSFDVWLTRIYAVLLDDSSVYHYNNAVDAAAIDATVGGTVCYLERVTAKPAVPHTVS